jgi:hypothetical protein
MQEYKSCCLSKNNTALKDICKETTIAYYIFKNLLIMEPWDLVILEFPLQVGLH